LGSFNLEPAASSATLEHQTNNNDDENYDHNSVYHFMCIPLSIYSQCPKAGNIAYWNISFRQSKSGRD
jgi:hypothetical protein